MDVRGHIAYLDVAGVQTPGLRLLDVSDPSAPAPLGFLASKWTSSGDGVRFSGATVVQLQSESVLLMDVSDPALPTEVGEITLDNPTTLDVFQDTLYVGALGGLHILTLAAPCAVSWCSGATKVLAERDRGARWRAGSASCEAARTRRGRR